MNLMELHHFWFDEIKIEDSYYKKKVHQWFFGLDPNFDLACKERFSNWLDVSEFSDSTILNLSSKEYLALIILFDQIPRNSFRGHKSAYDFDLFAQKLCLNALEVFDDKEFTFPERMFLYMPLEHAEDRVLQLKSVEKFSLLHKEAPKEIKKWTLLALEKATKHQETIEEFGCFPNRAKL